MRNIFIINAPSEYGKDIELTDKIIQMIKCQMLNQID